MPLYKFEVAVDATDEQEAKQVKAILTELCNEFGCKGIQMLHKDSQKGMGKTFTNKYRLGGIPQKKSK